MHELLPSICRNHQVSTWWNGAWGFDVEGIMSRMKLCHEWMMSQMNQLRMNHGTNELCHEWIMSRMNYVTNELCYEWIMSRMNYVLTNEYASSICRNRKGSTRRNGAWGFDDEWIVIRKDDVTNESCHEWINYEWIMARMNFSRMNQSRMNYVTNEYVSSIRINISIYMYVYIYMCHEGSTRWNFGWGLDMNESCHGWMMSRMNTYHPYAGIIKSRPGGTAREDSMMSESCDEWIVSRLNQSRLNQLRMNQLRMNHVTDGWCREWIRILNAQELWNLDPGEQHKRTRLRLKQPCWGKIRWSRLYSCIDVTAYIYVYTYTHVYAYMLRVGQVVYVWFYEYNCIAVR